MANRLTEKLIRKKSEHNDGLVTDLEELSLHQCEIGKLEVVGTLCRKLKILLLQNNVIPKIENIEHLKDLVYLNLALNNIHKIEGLQKCEFLKKLDLTVNFIDLDEYRDSVTHLSRLPHLQELFLMGNPCTEWKGHKAYLLARVPQLKRYDGQDITRSERILAAQQFPTLRTELKELAAAKRVEKGLPAVVELDDDEESCPWTPEVRMEIAVEQAEQKRQEEARKNHMAPPERDYEKEHKKRVEAEKEIEEKAPTDKLPRQCNEPKVDFVFDEEDGDGNITLTIPLSKYLDSSLLDVDVHPKFVTVVIKGKLLRLHLPEEVKPDSSKAQRSRTTGELKLVMPKEAPNQRVARMLKARREAEAKAEAEEKARKEKALRDRAPKKLADMMLEANPNAVKLQGIADGAPTSGTTMTARATTRHGVEESKGDDAEPAVNAADSDSDWEDDDDVPPLE